MELSWLRANDVGDRPTKWCAFLPKPFGQFCPPNPFHSPCSAQRCLTQRSPLENAEMMQDREPAKGEARTTAGRYSAVRTVGNGAVSLSLLLTEARISPWPEITACVRGVEQFLQIKTYSGPCSCPHPTPSPSDLKGNWRAPRVLWCKVCKLQEGEGANVPSSWNTWIPSSREVLGVWPEDREERATWPLARTPAAAIILWRRVQISSAIFPALLLGLSLEPLVLPNSNADPQKSSRVSSAAKYHPGKELHRKTAWE